MKEISENDLRTAIRLPKGLAARHGFLDIVGEIDEIADDLSEASDLNKALQGCVSLCGRVADRFEHQGLADHEQLVTVAGNLELWMFYISFGLREKGVSQGGIDLTRYRRLPLPEELRQLLSAYFLEAAAHIESGRGSREDLLHKGLDVEERIASYFRSLLTTVIAPPQWTAPTTAHPEPALVECTSLMDEVEFVARMTCPTCGRRVKSKRKGSTPDMENFRMMDHFEITCKSCKATWPLTVAINYQY